MSDGQIESAVRRLTRRRRVRWCRRKLCTGADGWDDPLERAEDEDKTAHVAVRDSDHPSNGDCLCGYGLNGGSGKVLVTRGSEGVTVVTATVRS